MGIKEQIGSEQWKVLLNAPGAASAYVSTASGGGFEIFSEVLTASKFAQELSKKTGGSGYGELVDEILAEMKEMSTKEARESSIKAESKDPAGIREELKQLLSNAAAVANTLPGAEGYKRWILDMVREVAETKTGGFLGIGGKSVVDEKEQAAMGELAELMGL